MARAIWSLGLLVVLLVPPCATAQVVQLPTYHVFSVGTTVSVPDRGTAYLGGVHRAAYGSSSYGVPGLGSLPGAGRLFRNRASGYDISSSGAYATATIMDLGELDRAVLAEAARRRESTGGRGTSAVVDSVTQRKAAFLAQHIGRTDLTRLTPVVDARPAGAADKEARSVPDANADAREAFQIAQQAEARGQWATARINYKRAALLSQGKLSELAAQRFAALSRPSDSK